MICDHMNVHVRTNKRYKERAVSLDLSWAVFRSTIAYIGYFCRSNITLLLFLIVDVRGFMKLFQEKKFMCTDPGG